MDHEFAAAPAVGTTLLLTLEARAPSGDGRVLGSGGFGIKERASALGKTPRVGAGW